MMSGFHSERREGKTKAYKHYLFDWGNTLMVDFTSEQGPMYKWSRVEAVAGALELLADLSKSAKCHIATNARDSLESDIRKALKRAGLHRYINEIFCFRNIGYEKPSKKFFESVMSNFECKKNEIVMIGDDLEKDVLGALAFGLDAIWLNRDHLPVPGNVVSIENLLQIIKP